MDNFDYVLSFTKYIYTSLLFVIFPIFFVSVLFNNIYISPMTITSNIFFINTLYLFMKGHLEKNKGCIRISISTKTVVTIVAVIICTMLCVIPLNRLNESANDTYIRYCEYMNDDTTIEDLQFNINSLPVPLRYITLSVYEEMSVDTYINNLIDECDTTEEKVETRLSLNYLVEEAKIYSNMYMKGFVIYLYILYFIGLLWNLISNCIHNVVYKEIIIVPQFVGTKTKSMESLSRDSK